MDYTELLLKLPLFAGLSPDSLSLLQKDDALVSISVKAGETLEAHLNGLCLLLSGKADIYTLPQHHPVLLRPLQKGALFGAASLFCKESLPLTHIVAKSACTFLILKKEAVCELLEQDRQFLYRYLTFLSERVAFLNQKIRCFTAGSATERLSLWLSQHESDRITLPTSLSTLAETLDIGRASLYRALDELTEKGFIKKSGRMITIRDTTALLEYTRKESL